VQHKGLVCLREVALAQDGGLGMGVSAQVSKDERGLDRRLLM